MILRATRPAVIGDLMIIPHADPRGAGMGGLEIGVGLVARVALAIIVERDQHMGILAVMGDDHRPSRRLQPPVAEPADEIRRLFDPAAYQGVSQQLIDRLIAAAQPKP